MRLNVHRRFHDVGPQRLWLLICDTNWETGTGEDDVVFDTPESLNKSGWHHWRTIQSHLLSDRDRKKPHDWSVYYRDVAHGTQLTLRTNSRRSLGELLQLVNPSAGTSGLSPEGPVIRVESNRPSRQLAACRR